MEGLALIPPADAATPSFRAEDHVPRLLPPGCITSPEPPPADAEPHTWGTEVPTSSDSHPDAPQSAGLPPPRSIDPTGAPLGPSATFFPLNQRRGHGVPDHVGPHRRVAEATPNPRPLPTRLVGQITTQEIPSYAHAPCTGASQSSRPWNYTMDETGGQQFRTPSTINRGSCPTARWRPINNTATPAEKREPDYTQQSIIAMMEALQFLVHDAKKQQAGPEATFSGDESEQPTAFVDKMEEYFWDNNTPDNRKISLIIQALRGNARRWAETVTRNDVPWPFFRSQFLTKYNSPAMVQQLKRKLYGENQGQKEDTYEFVIKKWHLFRRLAPDTPEHEQIANIKEQLVAAVRAHLVDKGFQDFQHFLEVVTSIATILKETEKTPTERAPPRRHEEPSPRNAPPGQATPPYPCRFCQEDHFHRDCPRAAARFQATPPQQQRQQQPPPRSLNPRQSGNDQRAETRGGVQAHIDKPGRERT